MLIRFFIGPKSDESLTPDLKPGDILETLAEGKPLDLTVTLFCNLTDTDTYQQQRIKYDPGTNQSGTATFRLVPKSAAVSQSNGLGKLIFVVDANGTEVDIIKIDAFVGNTTPFDLSKYTPPTKLNLDNILPDEISVPDLIISLAPQEGKAIPVIIRPIKMELRQKIRNVLQEPNGESWKFYSGVSTADIEDLVGDTYLELFTLARQRSDALQAAYERMGLGTTLNPLSAQLIFPQKDTAAILETMRQNGTLLYDRVFCDGDEGLSLVMAAISAFDEERILQRPLRLKIIASNIYAPWQILYPGPAPTPPATTDPKPFWGFRYELCTLQLANCHRGRTKTVFSPLQPNEILFGAWRGISGTSGPDKVRKQADSLKDYLENRFGKGLAFCLSKKEFLDRMEAGSRTIKLILAYGHGSSGTEVLVHTSNTGAEIPIAVQGVSGPYFLFGEGQNETLIPRDIDLLARRAQLDDITPYFFKSQPIVILNACETGTQGTGNANNNGFIGALTRAGARAVIATEAPVWANFAQYFGKDLIDFLAEGNDAQSALRMARLKHLKDGNPLGLLYSLYGNPGTRIKK
ncbi:MAG: CHAT domain-containing protein [Candidatus Aminicenantales bacterium]